MRCAAFTAQQKHTLAPCWGLFCSLCPADVDILRKPVHNSCQQQTWPEQFDNPTSCVCRHVPARVPAAALQIVRQPRQRRVLCRVWESSVYQVRRSPVTYAAWPPCDDRPFHPDVARTLYSHQDVCAATKLKLPCPNRNASMLSCPASGIFRHHGRGRRRSDTILTCTSTTSAAPTLRVLALNTHTSTCMPLLLRSLCFVFADICNLCGRSEGIIIEWFDREQSLPYEITMPTQNVDTSTCAATKCPCSMPVEVGEGVRRAMAFVSAMPTTTAAFKCACTGRTAIDEHCAS